MEVSFGKEVKSLRLGAGETFHGEGILAVTKALLQSGVSYVGGYQGAPVSHLLDVMVQAEPYMKELGVHVEACANEASAAAMLGASIHYPLRGAVTWKSIVGTNVAADALSNLSSPGVVGGALIVVGEDYGEGASVIQERTHAYALKSSMLMLDPRPELGNMVRIVEHAFRLSEASNMPAMLELRIRACHVRGSFVCKDNVAPRISTQQTMAEPARFDYARLAHPPVTFGHEKLKTDERIPAARRYIVEHALNEHHAGTHGDVGIVVQGGLYNTLVRALQQLGLADAFGASELPLLVLNVTYPIVPDEIVAFAAGKRAVLVVEEGQPEYIERDILAALHRAGSADRAARQGPAADGRRIHGRGDVGRARRRSSSATCPTIDVSAGRAWLAANAARRGDVAARLGKAAAGAAAGLLHRLPRAAGVRGAEAGAAGRRPGPHRRRHRLPRARDLRAVLVGPLDPRLRHEPGVERRRRADDEAARALDHGRRRLLAQRPAHRRAVVAVQRRRLGAADHEERLHLGDRHAGHHLDARRRDEGARARSPAEPGRPQHDDRVDARRASACKWLRTVHTYRVAEMKKTLREAFTTDFAGLKVIIAEGECQLERQRRVRPWIASLLKRGKRVVRVKYGVDEDVCTGDHACIRLSGCPTLTLEGQPRSAQARSGRDRDRRLRRLRPVRRERARGDALPVVLSRRDRPEPALARAPGRDAAARDAARAAAGMRRA